MKIKAISFVAVLGLALAACGEDADAPGGEDAGGENYPAGPVQFIAPADPGSGWDLTARAITADLAAEDIVSTPMPVENRPGGVGTVFFAEMVERRGGEDNIIGVTSMAMSVNTAMGQTDYSVVDDVTMIAAIATEHFVVIASPGSGYTDLNDIAEAIESDAGGTPVGAATDDQLPFSLLMDEAGVDPSTINYVTYEGGGEQSAALLSGDIDVAIAGYSELQALIDSGDAVGIAILSEEPVDGIDIQTAIEQDIDVELTNWRGIYGPPDMPDYAVEFWADALEELVETESWAETVERHQWTTQFLRGDELDEYVAETQAMVDEGIELVGSQ